MLDGESGVCTAFYDCVGLLDTPLCSKLCRCKPPPPLLVIGIKKELIEASDDKLCVVDFENLNRLSGLEWFSTSLDSGFGNDVDGNGVFINHIVSNETSNTLFTFPVGTSDWGADFDLSESNLDSPVKIIAGGFSVAELEPTFSGFFGVHAGDDFTFSEILIQTECSVPATFIIDNMCFKKQYTGSCVSAYSGCSNLCWLVATDFSFLA